MIYLVRHGETTWNWAGRQQGHLDPPFTPKGVEQAHAAERFLRQALPDVQTVCIDTSPLGRARQTAAILYAELGLDVSARVISPLLIEGNLGAWQGLTHAEIDAQYPGARQAREAHKGQSVVPGGESYALVDSRARQWLASRRHAPVTIAVTHAMLSRTMQGASGALTPTETLGRAQRQDRIYWLHDGQIVELLCGMGSAPRLRRAGGLWASAQVEPKASVLSTSQVQRPGVVEDNQRGAWHPKPV